MKLFKNSALFLASFSACGERKFMKYEDRKENTKFKADFSFIGHKKIISQIISKRTGVE